MFHLQKFVANLKSLLKRIHCTEQLCITQSQGIKEKYLDETYKLLCEIQQSCHPKSRKY